MKKRALIQVIPSALSIKPTEIKQFETTAITNSIEEAMALIRKWKNEKYWPENGVVVELYGGDYFLEKGIIFCARDSGRRPHARRPAEPLLGEGRIAVTLGTAAIRNRSRRPSPSSRKGTGTFSGPKRAEK